MDQNNPISILIVLGGMAFLFLGLMQYLVNVTKSNDTTRLKLVDQLATLKIENADLTAERDELKEDIQKYKRLVKKYYALANRLYDENEAMKTSQKVTEIKVTENKPD